MALCLYHYQIQPPSILLINWINTAPVGKTKLFYRLAYFPCTSSNTFLGITSTNLKCSCVRIISQRRHDRDPHFETRVGPLMINLLLSHSLSLLKPDCTWFFGVDILHTTPILLKNLTALDLLGLIFCIPSHLIKIFLSPTFLSETETVVSYCCREQQGPNIRVIKIKLGWSKTMELTRGPRWTKILMIRMIITTANHVIQTILKSN